MGTEREGRGAMSRRSTRKRRNRRRRIISRRSRRVPGEEVKESEGGAEVHALREARRERGGLGGGEGAERDAK